MILVPRRRGFTLLVGEAYVPRVTSHRGLHTYRWRTYRGLHTYCWQGLPTYSWRGSGISHLVGEAYIGAQVEQFSLRPLKQHTSLTNSPVTPLIQSFPIDPFKPPIPMGSLTPLLLGACMGPCKPPAPPLPMGPLTPLCGWAHKVQDAWEWKNGEG